VLDAQHVQAPAPAEAYKSRFFTDTQIKVLTELCEIILPADDRSPGARKAGVWRYLDLYAHHWGKEVQDQFESGLKLVEQLAMRRFSKPFLELPPDDRENIVATMAERESNLKDKLGRFFVLLKGQTILGYHYSEAGMKHYMGYSGEPVAEFPGCYHPEHQRS
jgi:gluconate 2-dehydrogenase gamma chain